MSEYDVKWNIQEIEAKLKEYKDASNAVRNKIARQLYASFMMLTKRRD